jgi:hypothetical protein
MMENSINPLGSEEESFSAGEKEKPGLLELQAIMDILAQKKKEGSDALRAYLESLKANVGKFFAPTLRDDLEKAINDAENELKTNEAKDRLNAN